MINYQFTPTKTALNFWRRQQTVMRSNKIRWNQNKDQEKIEKFYRFGLRISSMLKNAHFSESSFFLVTWLKKLVTVSETSGPGLKNGRKCAVAAVGFCSSRVKRLANKTKWMHFKQHLLLYRFTNYSSSWTNWENPILYRKRLWPSMFWWFLKRAMKS